MPEPAIGAQVYTIRQHLRTPADIAESFARIRRIGYTTIQLAGLGPIEPAELARIAADCGLDIVGSHGGWERFLTDLDGIIQEHKLWNCKHPGIWGLEPEYLSRDGIDRFIGELHPVAAKLADAGMDFSYHNHAHELADCNGKNWLETLYESTSASELKVQLDLYWVRHGGQDPLEWLKRYPGRQPLVHIKDYTVTDDGEKRFAEIGSGELDWAMLMKTCEEMGVQYAIVEQDDCYGRDPFESLAISYNYLKELGWA